MVAIQNSRSHMPLAAKKGGLIHARHDESRDSLGCLACAGFQPSNVHGKPQINPCHVIGGKEESYGETLIESNSGTEIIVDRGDLLIRVFFYKNTDCIKDVRICDVNQASYQLRKPAAIIKAVEGDKKRKYLGPCLTQRRHFTPFVVSYEGLLKKEVDTFLKRLSKKLADKWRRPYSQVVSFVKTRFAISLVRSKNRCIRGSIISTGRILYRDDWKDGAGLVLFSTLE